MISIQLKNGQTLAFDLRNQKGRLAWNSFQRGDGWQQQVTAMGINCNKTLYSLPVPNHGLKSNGFGAELIRGKPKQNVLGESVWLHVKGLKIELQVFSTNHKVVKVAVEKSLKAEE